MASGRLSLPSEPPKQNEMSNEITAQVHLFSEAFKANQSLIGSGHKGAPKTKEQTPTDRTDCPTRSGTLGATKWVGVSNDLSPGAEVQVDPG